MPKHPFCVSCNKRLWKSSGYKFDYEGKTYWSLTHKSCYSGMKFGIECMEKQLANDDSGKYPLLPKERSRLEKAIAKFKYLIKQASLPPGDPPYSEHPPYIEPT